jgi:hypothetical protein
MKLDNRHRYTTRSLRSILTWAWNQAKRDLTTGQRNTAEYGESIITIREERHNNIPGRHTLDFAPKAEAKAIAKHAVVLWRWRAGIKSPWRGLEGIDWSTAPKPAMPAKRKPKPKVTRNRAMADVDKWTQKLADKVAHQQRIEHELAVLEQRKKTLKRRLKKAKTDRRNIRQNVKRARERAVEEPTTEMSERDFATRMRAKRQAEGTAPAAR